MNRKHRLRQRRVDEMKRLSEAFGPAFARASEANQEMFLAGAGFFGMTPESMAEKFERQLEKRLGVTLSRRVRDE